MVESEIQVEIVYAEPNRQLKLAVDLPENTTVEDALRQSGILTELPEQILQNLQVGIFGKLCGLDYHLQNADRIEIYRPLLLDPKDARRQRASKSMSKKPPPRQ
jgi:uncharacterized protein